MIRIYIFVKETLNGKKIMTLMKKRLLQSQSLTEKGAKQLSKKMFKLAQGIEDSKL